MPNLKYYSIKEKPFSVHGLANTDGTFERIPQSVLDKAINSDSAEYLNSVAKESSGIRVRFATNSKNIGLKFKHKHLNIYTPMGSIHLFRGLDLYIDNGESTKFVYAFAPSADKPTGFESECTLDVPDGFNEYTLYLPVSTKVESLEIGLDENAQIKEHTPYKYKKPVLYYGSSITHGYHAGRPSLTYPCMVSKKYGIDFYNMGLSGSCRAELPFADYFGSLDISAFVFDYDFNAPTPEFLEKTHKPFFERLRQLKPELPVIFVTRPSWGICETTTRRRAIIMKTFVNAVENGDKNVYFVDGLSFFDNDSWAEYTVDGTHPNNSGFERMAKQIGETVFAAINK